MNYVLVYGAMALAFLALDAAWLGVVAKKFYRKHVGHILAPSPNFVAAVLFYAVYIFGILALVVVPARNMGSFHQLLWSAGLFGLVCYAAYDLTSQAVVKGWPGRVTIVDLLWGVFVTTTVAAVGYQAMSLLFI